MTNQAGQTQRRTVVVGIDGSECSTGALEWAASYAQATGTPVRAVAVWSYPTPYEFDVGGGDWDRESECTKTAEKQVASVATRHPGLEIDLEVVNGHAAKVLVDASANAALLVVGTRGHGGFVDLMIGSTSTHCVHSAHCPVVVYR
jgi:nucleotide-binding universal stress UspA family protein